MTKFQEFLNKKNIGVSTPQPIQQTKFQSFLSAEKEREISGEEETKKSTKFESFMRGDIYIEEPKPIPLVEGKPKEEERVGLFESIENFINPKSIRAVKNNNPGNLKSGSMLHDSLASKNSDGSVKTDDQGHLVFPNQQVGWLASYADLDAKMTGLTRNELLANKAGVDVSIADLNQAYATDTNWKYGVTKIYNKITGAKITTNTDVSTLDRDALQLAVLTQEGFVLPKIDANLYSRLKDMGIKEPEAFTNLPVTAQKQALAGEDVTIEGFLDKRKRIPSEEVTTITEEGIVFTPEDKRKAKEIANKALKDAGVIGISESLKEGLNFILKKTNELNKSSIEKLPDGIQKPVQKTYDIVKAGMKGLAGLIYRTPQAAETFLLETAEKAGTKPTFGPVDIVFPQRYLGRLAQYSTAEKIETDEKIINWSKEKIQQNMKDMEEMGLFLSEDATKGEKFAFQYGSGMGSLLLALGTTYITGSPVAASIAFGQLQKSDTYLRAREAGVSVEKASSLSTLAGITEGSLEFIGLNWFLRRFSSPVISIAVKIGTEALQEALQELGGNAWERVGWNDKKNLVEGVAMAALMGALISAPVSISYDIAERNGIIKGLKDVGLTDKEAKSLVTSIIKDIKNDVNDTIEKEVLPKVRIDRITKSFSNTALLDTESSQKDFTKNVKNSITKYFEENGIKEKPSQAIREEIKKEPEEKITENKILDYAKNRKIELLAKSKKEITTLERIELSNLKKKIKGSIVKDETWIKNFYKDKIAKPVEKKPSQIIKEKVQKKRAIKKEEIKPKELEPLAVEARKYESAEEFVEIQPKVYHGSPVKLKQFNEKEGIFFTDDYADATGFAGSPDNIYEGYLNFKNPLTIDAKGRKWDNIVSKYGKSTQEVISNAERDGYDGVIFKNIIDNIGDDVDSGTPGTIYYAFNPRKSFLNESQLTDFYNQAVKEVKPISKELEPLVIEAKKYKSAEEFVYRFKTLLGDVEITKEGNVLLYHGTNNKAEIMKSGGFIIPKSPIVRGGKIVSKSNVTPSLKEASNYGEVLKIEVPMEDFIRWQKYLDTVPNSEITGATSQMELFKKAKVFVGSKNDILTKSQLTDIYNQAIKEVKPISKELEPLVVEARKYKSAEEFVKENMVKGTPTRNIASEANKIIYVNDIPIKMEVSKLFPTETAGTKKLMGLEDTFTDIKAGKKITEPIIVSEKGTIYDGHNRYFQAVANGDKTIDVYIKKPNDVIKSQLTNIYNQAIKEVKPTEKLLTKVKKYGIIEIIRKNGGITINLEGKKPTQGLAFAPRKDTEEKIPKEKLTEEYVVSFIKKNIKELSTPKNYLGAWYNEEDGKIYIDVSRVGKINSETIYEAYEAEQLKVFDLKNFKEIKTPYYYEKTYSITFPKGEDTRRISQRIYEGYKSFLQRGGKGEVETLTKKEITELLKPKKKTSLDKAKERYELEQKKKSIEKRKVETEKKKRIAERRKKTLAEIKEKKSKKILAKDKVKETVIKKTEKEQQAEADRRVEKALEEIENERVKKDLELYQKKVKAKKIIDANYGIEIIKSYNKRLGLDIKVKLTDIILTGRSYFGIKEKAWAMAQPGLGTITLTKQIERWSAHHEITHIVWTKENFEKIPAFRGLDRNAILNDITGGKKMTDLEVQEKLAIGFAKFAKDKEQGKPAYYNVKGKYLRRFFHSLWNGLKKMFGLGKELNNVQKFYDTLYSSEVRAKEVVSMEVEGEVEELFQKAPFEATTREERKKANEITPAQRRKIGALRAKDEKKYQEAKKKIGITTSKDISKLTAMNLINALVGKATRFVKKGKYDSKIKEIMTIGKGWKSVKSISALNQAKELKELQKKKAFVKTHKLLSSFVNQHLTAYQILRDISIKIGDKTGALVDRFIDSHDKNFDKYLVLKRNTETELKDITKKYKTSLGKISTTTGFKGKQKGWKSFTQAERIQVLLAKYDKGKRLAILRKEDGGYNDGILLKSTGDKAYKMSLASMEEIWEKALPVEKEIAKWWVAKSKEYLELINPVLKRLGYEQIDGEEGYSTLFREYVESKPLVSMDELIYDMFGKPSSVGKKGVPKKWDIERKDTTTGRAVIGNAVSDILRDVDRKAYFIEASEQIKKNISILHDRYFKENFVENFGLAKWNELSHWSKGLISPFKQGANESWEKGLKKVSRNVSLSFVLARGTTAVLQAASFTHGIGFLGYEATPYFLKTFGDTVKHPKQVRDFVYEVFPEAKDRFFMPLMAELQNIHDNTKFGNIKNNILKGGTYLAKMFDKVVIPLVYTAYNMELTKTGSIDKAYAKGMAVLRETQPMGTLKDMPRILGGGNERALLQYVLGRLRTYVTKRTTYTFTRLFRPDRIYRVQTGTTAQKVAKTTATFMWDNFWSLIMTSFVTFLIKHRRPPEKKKDILECLSYPFLGIFGIGHILGMLTYGITNFSTIPGQLVNRLIWAINASIKAVKNKDEEQALKALKHSVILAAMYTGLPSTQPELFVSYLLDKIKGDDPSLWRLLYRQNVLEEKGKEVKSSGIFKLMKSDFGGGFKGGFKDSF